MNSEILIEIDGMESKNIFTLKIEKLKGRDHQSFNAFCKAVSAINFINFINNFSELVEDFFDNVKISKGGEVETFLLSRYYQKMDMLDLKIVFEKVLDFRKNEFEPLINNSGKGFKELSDYEKTFYKLLFLYGEKIGGYTALALLSPIEVSSIAKYFGELKIEKKEAIDNALKNNKK